MTHRCTWRGDKGPEWDPYLIMTILKLKEDGNVLFRKKLYHDALHEYTYAINLWPDLTANAVTYGNRSACLFYMRMYDEALRDVEKAKELDPGYKKYYPRVIKYNSLKCDFGAVRKTIEHLVNTKKPFCEPLKEEIRHFCKMEKLHQQAMQAFEEGWYQHALYYIHELIENGAHSQHVSIVHAKCLAQEGMYYEGLALSSWILLRDPTNVHVLYVRAFCNYFLSHFDKAAIDITMVLKVEEDRHREQQARRERRHRDNTWSWANFEQNT